MAISIDPATLVITVPQADCVFVSGTFYRLPTKTTFKAQVDALMDNEEHIWMQHPIDHNTEYTVAGVEYAPKVEVVNGYSVEFTPDSQWTVELTESNNNLFDVENGILVQNQVQVIATNSAGLIRDGVATSDDIWERIHPATGFTMDQLMNIIVASQAGKISGLNPDILLPKIRDLADTKDIISAVTDIFGNRSSVVLDP